MSKGAVSFALNGRPGISPADPRAASSRPPTGSAGRPSARARALSVSKALAVGLVIARPPEILRADAFFPAFIAGLETVLSAQGHALLLQVAERDDLAAYRRLAAEGRVDGVFVTDLHVDDERPALLEELGPAGRRHRPAPRRVRRARSPRSAWTTPRASGRRSAPRRPRAQRIAHVAGPDDVVHGRSRREAWSDALVEAGLAAGPCVAADFSAEGGAGATAELLDLAEPPTAIVYANDLMAMAGLSLAAQPRAVRSPATSRSPASTTSRSPHTCSPR